ncbi:MAG: capsular polysaccharide biosynthesis protein [Clostridia bacterium]|nr:capsular polysaccharide biosynthesis protein [Clostridia bacterium]
MLTEYHCHILPCIDDGSDSLETSLEMIRLMHEQGVRRIVATPHFYAHREKSVAHFLEKRDYAYDRLMQAGPAIKNILLGAEVAIERGISTLPDISKLVFQDTDLIMLEFPYKSFEGWMAEELDDIAVKYGLEIIIAHVHRYQELYSKSDFETLLSLNALYQINNEAFADRKEKKVVKRLIKERYPLVFGSDAHNMQSRRPNWDLLQKKAEKSLIFSSDRLLEKHRLKTDWDM